MYIHSSGRKTITIIIFFSILFFCSLLFYAQEDETSHSAISLSLPRDVLPFLRFMDNDTFFSRYYKVSMPVFLSKGFIDFGGEGEHLGWGPFDPVLLMRDPVVSMEVLSYEEYDGTLESREGRHPTSIREDVMDEALEIEPLEEEEPIPKEDEAESLVVVDPIDVVDSEDLLDFVELVELVQVVDYEEKEVVEEVVEDREEVVVEEEEMSPTYQLTDHRVSPGETLWSIAQEHGVDVDTIIGANPQLENANQLTVGQSIKVLSQKGLIHEVYRGETLWEISRSYNLSIEEIVEANDMDSNEIIQPGDTIFLPGVSSNQRPVRYMWPVEGPISSYFGPRWGRMHEGIDIVVPVGTPVKATRSGRVTVSGWVGAYGYVVYIDHGDGLSSRYAHNSRLLVRPGEYVNQGQTIALSGSTGQSTGPHVHFEIRERGRAINPLNYLQSR